MHLAFVPARSPGSVDATFRAVADRLARQGLRLAGVVQEARGPAECHRCDRDLIDLASGARTAIGQSLGKGARGCRLDGGAIEAAAMRVAGALERGTVDLLIVNKFGKLESTGRGFAPLIATALERDIPVIVGVNDLNRPAFDAFAGGLATTLPDRAEAVLAWVGPLLRRAAA